MPNPLDNWLRRHNDPVSFWLHMIGIPACFLAAPALLAFAQWGPAAVAFVSGYALQFLGHAVEGNRSGEEMLVRRLLDRTD